MHILKRSSAVLGAAVAVLVVSASPAFAGTGTINPASPIPVISAITNNTASETIPLTVSWSGLSTGGAPFILACKKSITDPTYDYLSDCAFITEYAGNPSDNAGGSGSVTSFEVLHGKASGKKWGFYTASEAPSVPTTGGFTAYTSGFIRITKDSEDNTIDQFEIPFTLKDAAVANPTTPEAPIAVLLPVGAALAAGGYLLLQRRRGQAAA